MLRLLVGTRFQVLFHSAPAVLFTFPSRYFFPIGRMVVFSLRRWSSPIQTGFLVSRPTLGPCQTRTNVSTTGLSPSLAGLPMPFLYARSSSSAGSVAPACMAPLPCIRNADRLTRIQFRLFPVRSPLLRESLLFSLPRGTEMFQFPRCPPHRLCIQRWVSFHHEREVPPFGDPWIDACVRLPKAFRCSPRPSSAPCA